MATVEDGVAFRSYDSVIKDGEDDRASPKIELRQEVAFERWFYSYHKDLSHEKASECTKRTWAVIACLEGALKTAAEAVVYVITWLAELCWPTAHSSAKHLKALKAQARGAYLSAIAVYSPEAAVKAVHAADDKSQDSEPYIGCSSEKWEWGTPYRGRLTRWSFECCCDPWVEVKN